MISRHAERYPTLRVGNNMLSMLQRIRELNVTLTGNFEFLNEWEYFCFGPSERFRTVDLDWTLRGTLEAFRTGVKLRTRYVDFTLRVFCLQVAR